MDYTVQYSDQEVVDEHSNTRHSGPDFAQLLKNLTLVYSIKKVGVKFESNFGEASPNSIFVLEAIIKYLISKLSRSLIKNICRLGM